MKLISIFKMKKTNTLTVVILLALIAQANVASAFGIRRVFWNKFDVVSNDKNEVVLTWNVTEYNNRSFRVQHSVDGVKWQQIGVVHTKNNGETMTDYSYTYSIKTTGKHFFRLQDIDLDYNSISSSPVKTLVLSKVKPAVSVWPNPATSQLNLPGTNNYSKAQVFDLSGRMIIEKQFGEGSNSINIAELQPGTYVLRLQSADGNFENEKFVKQ